MHYGILDGRFSNRKEMLRKFKTQREFVKRTGDGIPKDMDIMVETNLLIETKKGARSIYGYRYMQYERSMVGYRLLNILKDLDRCTLRAMSLGIEI
jgi:hypothetical protein